MIHTSVWASGQFSKLSRNARLTYIGMITLGDDDGRLKGSAALIKSQLYPYDDDTKVGDVAKWIAEIVAQKLLIGYNSEGEEYFFHPKWESYQHIREDRRKDSNIPAPEFEFAKVETNSQPNGNQKTTKRQHSIVKDSIVKDSIDKYDHESAFQTFWSAYPRKISKKQAWKAWIKINNFSVELMAKIMGALLLAKESEQWVKDSGRYIPHPATWINGERWEDELVPAKKKNGKYEKFNAKKV